MENLVAVDHGEEGAANQSRGYVGRRELREVGQPCEGRSGGGDDRPDTTRVPQTPGGAIGDLPDLLNESSLSVP
jgi:hypothetical protein